MRVAQQGGSSQLPRVLLQLNPGLGRQLQSQLRLTGRLKEKAKRTKDVERAGFADAFDRRMEEKRANVSRHMRMDEETRRTVDAIKMENRYVFWKQHIYLEIRNVPVLSYDH